MTKDFCWILEEDLVYENDKYIITVKAGFDFDFASVPKIITNILPKNGQEYDRAACLHDALYASNWLPKSECDRLLYEAMLADGVNKTKAWTMYQAVKWFGGSAYKPNNDSEMEYYRQFVTVGIKE